MTIKPVLVPDHNAADLRALMDSFATAAQLVTPAAQANRIRQQLTEMDYGGGRSPHAGMGLPRDDDDDNPAGRKEIMVKPETVKKTRRDVGDRLDQAFAQAYDDKGVKEGSAGWMLRQDPALAKKVRDNTQGYKDLKKMAGKPVPKKDEKSVAEGIGNDQKAKTKIIEMMKDALDKEARIGRGDDKSSKIYFLAKEKFGQEFADSAYEYGALHVNMLVEPSDEDEMDERNAEMQELANKMGYKHINYSSDPGLDEGVAEGSENNPVVNAITRRIMIQRSDLLSKYGPEKVGQAVDEVADFVGDVEEIGSSDVSGWVRHVEQMLGNMEQDVAEEAAAPTFKPGDRVMYAGKFATVVAQDGDAYGIRVDAQPGTMKVLASQIKKPSYDESVAESIDPIEQLRADIRRFAL